MVLIMCCTLILSKISFDSLCIPFISPQELVLEDSLVGKAKKTFLYKLSENGVLSHFNKVVLVSSPKDQYVPSYSARIQVTHECKTFVCILVIDNV